VDSNISGRIT